MAVKSWETQLGEAILSANDLKRIDRLVGAEGRKNFIRSAVNHALFLEEHLRAYRERVG